MSKNSSFRRVLAVITMAMVVVQGRSVAAEVHVQARVPGGAAIGLEEQAPVRPLLRVSPVWKNLSMGAVGLPSLREDIIRFATEDAIYEGTSQSLRPRVERSGLGFASSLSKSTDEFAFFQRDSDRLNYDMQADDLGVPFVAKSAAGDSSLYFYRGPKSREAATRLALGASIPQGSGVFQRLRYPVTGEGRTVFLGYGSQGQSGIYSVSDAGISLVADTHARAPGTDQTFVDFSYARPVSGGRVVFTGYAPNGSGVYIWREGQLSSLVDRQGVEPKSKRKYAGALLVGQEGEWVYFTSFGATLSIGRVRLDGSGLETLVDDQSALPGETVAVGAINYVSVEGGRLVFEAASTGADFNLYLWEQGRIETVVRCGDRVPEGRITSVRCGLQGLSGNHFACLLDVQGSNPGALLRAVYVGELPASSGQSIGLGPVTMPPAKTTGWLRPMGPPTPVRARERQGR